MKYRMLNIHALHNRIYIQHRKYCTWNVIQCIDQVANLIVGANFPTGSSLDVLDISFHPITQRFFLWKCNTTDFVIAIFIQTNEVTTTKIHHINLVVYSFQLGKKHRVSSNSHWDKNILVSIDLSNNMFQLRA